MSVKVLRQDAWNHGTYEVSTVGKEPFGALRIGWDGSKYRYASFNAVIPGGNLCEQVPDGDANMVAQAMPTIAIGAKTFTFTPGGAVTYAENELQGGYVMTTEGTGLGQIRRIAGNTAEAAGTVLPIELEEGFAVATDTADTKGSVYPSQYRLVIKAATITNPVVGVAVATQAAGQYGWLQTAGLSCVLVTGTPALGSYVIANATDGSVGIAAASIARTSQIIGVIVNTAGATGKYYPVMLLME